MEPKRWRILDSRPVFLSVGLVTFALLTTSTAFTIIDATELRLRLATYRSAALGAAILDFFALASVAVLIVSRLCCSGGWVHRWFLPWTGALIALAAGIISLNTLVLKKINPKDVSQSQEDSSSRFLSHLNITAEFVLWTLAVIAEVFFYTLIVLMRTSVRDRRSRSSFPQEKNSTRSKQTTRSKKRNAPERPPTPPTPLRIIAPHFALPETSAPAPAFIQTPKDLRRDSWRDSLHSLQNIVRPINSRTRLLASSRHSSRQSFSRDSSVQSDTRSIATTTHSDGFDSWDIFPPDLKIRENFPPVIPSRGTALETIPGSRPVSPGDALNGPFHPSTYHDSSSTVVLDRPPTALSYASRHERPGTTQSYYSNFSKRTFIPADHSQPSSPATSEAHIHPLFRSDSPTPPPETSAGTVITASPFGGQVITSPPAGKRSFSRMRSESRASSRTVSRAPSPAFIPNSIDERHALTSLSSYTTSKGTSIDSRRSRSSSPVSRTMTPPIPEFILSASKETLRSTSSKDTLH
jgi:hypothetical protein